MSLCLEFRQSPSPPDALSRPTGVPEPSRRLYRRYNPQIVGEGRADETVVDVPIPEQQ